MNNEIENFLQLLELSGLISRDDFASLSQNETPEDILDALELVGVSNAKLSEVYAKFRSVPFVQIVNIDPVALEIIDSDLARRFGFIPFSVDENNKILQVAITDGRKLITLSEQNLKNLGDKIGYKIEIMMASRSQVEQAISKAHEEKNIHSTQASKAEEASLSANGDDVALEQELGKKSITGDDLKNYSNSDDIPKLTAGIIAFSLEHRASDIHVEPFEKVVRVRIRVDGEMEDIIALPYTQLPGIISRTKLLASLKLEEERIPQDGRFSIIFAGHNIDIRVSTLPTIFGEKITLRLLPKTKKLINLETLGLDGLSHDNLIRAIEQPYGVVIVTGPTGSGKTTTIYSILGRLDKPQVDIITLEETIEYELPRVNQVKLQPHLGFGYAEGLRSVLKQDPNIIYVGEISEKETAELAIHAALTGRLVLTTLHTNNSAQALPRLYNMGVDPFLLTSAIKAVTAQRLVRHLCPKCKEEYSPSTSIVSMVKKELEGLSLNLPIVFYRAKGCSQCKSGYLGRIAIFEVLPMSHKIEELVIAKKTHQEIETAARLEGVVTMRQDGFLKVFRGLTTVEEVIKATTIGI